MSSTWPLRSVFRESKSPNLFKVAKPLFERMIGANAFPGKGTMIANLVVISNKGLALTSVPQLKHFVKGFTTFLRCEYMGLTVTIKPYLETLKLNAAKRTLVPSVPELAEIVGMHPNSYRRLAQNETGKIDKEAIDKTIIELRRRGFDTQVTDLLVYTDD